MEMKIEDRRERRCESVQLDGPEVGDDDSGTWVSMEILPSHCNHCKTGFITGSRGKIKEMTPAMRFPGKGGWISLRRRDGTVGKSQHDSRTKNTEAETTG